MDELIKILIDYGSLGIMCAVLLWLHVQNSKKAEAQTTQFLSQLDKMREDRKEEEQAIRDRFMEVVSKYDSERTQLRTNLAGQIKDLENNLQILTGKLDALQVAVTDLGLKVQEIITEQKMRDIAQQQSKSAGKF